MVLNKAAECEVPLLKIDEVRASRNNKVGTVDVHDTMIVEFDCHIGKIDSTGETWESIFHIGDTNSIRQPGMWFHPSADDQDAAFDGFTYAFGTISNWNEYQAPSKAGDAFTDDSVVRFKSVQTQGTLTIWENGKIMFQDNNWGPHPTYTNEAVYVGDPWYVAADVVLKNLKISTMEECAINCNAVDIDRYLTQCSEVFKPKAFRAADNQVKIDLRSEFSAADDELEARLVAMIEDAHEQETAPIIDFSNHILLFSLFTNIIVIILASYFFCNYKVNNMKYYGKVAAFSSDPDTENQPLQ